LYDASQASGATAHTLIAGEVLNSYEYLSADNKKLWTEHLWKFIAEAVLMVAFPEGFVQFQSAGVVHNQPASGPMNTSGIVTPELKTVKWAMDKKMMMRLDPLRESMHQWLCKQQKADKTKYTLYTMPCDCNADGVAYKRKTAFITGIYDDEDESNNCCS